MFSLRLKNSLEFDGFVSFISEGSSAHRGNKSVRRGGKKTQPPNPNPKPQLCRKKEVTLPVTASASYLPVNEFFASGSEMEETAPHLSLQRPEHPQQKGNPTGSDLQSSFNLPQAQT